VVSVIGWLIGLFAQRLTCIMHIYDVLTTHAYALFLGQVLHYEFLRWILDSVASDCSGNTRELKQGLQHCYKSSSLNKQVKRERLLHPRLVIFNV
jgi:hypothetical protein